MSETPDKSPSELIDQRIADLGDWRGETLAHARAPASLLAPFIYTQILWSVLLGYLVFGDVPGLWTVAGTGVIVASGLALLAEDSLRRRRARRG